MSSHPRDKDTQPYIDRVVQPVNERSPTAPKRVEELAHLECREHLRVAYYLETTLYGEHHFTSGLVTNLSMGGMFVECYEFLSLDEDVKVDLELPGGKLWCDARIAWMRDRMQGDERPGMGLQFIGLCENQQALLRHALDIALEVD
jgi:Tfp pilus assembly protein PilZ